MKDKNSFIMYVDWYEAISELTTEQKGLLLDAIFKYHLTGEEPEKNSVLKMPFAFMKAVFVINNDKYQRIVERNRENGSKGGRPVKNPVGYGKPSGCNDNDTGTGTDNSNDTGTDNEKEITDNANKMPPSLEMVSNYCKVRNNGINPQTFIDFYSSKGWFVGKQKMKDWQASVRTWEGRDQGSGANTSPGVPEDPIQRNIKRIEEAERLMNLQKQNKQ